MSKISELSDGGSLVSSDYLIAVRSGGNVKVRMDQINVDQIDLGDNEFIRLGNSQDLTIVHDASNSIINQAGIGDLLIQKAGSTKLTVNSSGIDVTGSVTADGLTVDGGNTIRLNPSSGDDFLTISQGTTDANITADSTAGNANLKLFTTASGTTRERLDISFNGDISFYEDTGTTPKFFWDASAESLGIGTSSPVSELDVAGTTPTLTIKDTQNKSWTSADTTLGELAFRTSDTSGIGAHNVAFVRAVNEVASGSTPSGALSFGVAASNANASEAMRLDASSNLLVGQSTASSNTVGTSLRPDGRNFYCADGNYSGHFNRKSSDGAIVHFAKDDTIVGSIGVASGPVAYIVLNDTTSDNVAALKGAGGAILPSTNAGADKDGTMNLGSSGARFENLYLSGSIISGANGGLIKEIGGDTSIVQGAIGLRINDAALALSPTTASANNDASVDLGVSNVRFKDLHLSGDVNVTGGKISSYASDSSAPYFADAGNVGIRLSQAGVDDIVPCSTTGADRDNGINFGAAGARWGTIFAATGAINTSDQNEKQDIAELSEAEQRVAVAAKGLLRKFRWKDSVAEKGDAARTHVGIMAQDLQAAFAAEGLNASDYAMWCSDTWTDKETGEEHTRMGVRYSELLAFIIAAL